MAVAPDALKQLLGRRAAAVAIVTARVGERIHGMTVTAYTEVSLEPPLVLVCADRASNTHPVIAAGGVFALNLLSDGQAELSNRFASKRDEERRFEGIAWETAVTGAPILPDGEGWPAMIRLRDRARAEVVRRSGEPPVDRHPTPATRAGDPDDR